MLPKPQDGPSSGLELEIRVAVSAPIGFNLRAPPIRICPWPRAVLGASMPEASVDEDRDPGSNERYVGPAACAGQGYVDSVAQSKCTEGRAQSDLAWRVASSSCLHSATDVCRRGPRPGDLLVRFRL